MLRRSHSGGPKRYLFKLFEIINEKNEDFSPAGFDDWKTGESTEQQELGSQRVKNIRALMVFYVFEVFRKEYGTEMDAYFEQGITDKDLKKKAFSQAQDVDFKDRAPLENYLDILDYKKIIEAKNNWPLFDKVLNIPLEGEKAKPRNTSWIAIFNDARKSFEHSTIARTPKPEEIDYLEWLERELYQRFTLATLEGDEIAEKALSKITIDLK